MPRMNLGDTELLIEECKRNGLSRKQAAYVLATAYLETGETMRPVCEAYWLSEEWRKDNLRYYPWYGRGYVQLTWQENYERAGAKLGVDLTTDPDVAMKPELSATITVRGMLDGWFTGKKLSDYITAHKTDFRNARKIVNGMDRAADIESYAYDYDGALQRAGYGDEPAPRASRTQSTTLQAVGAAAVSGGGGTVIAVSRLDSNAQMAIIVLAAISAAALAWIFRERIRKWAEGDR